MVNSFFSIVLKNLFCSSSREAAVLELPDRLILDITHTTGGYVFTGVCLLTGGGYPVVSGKLVSDPFLGGTLDRPAAKRIPLDRTGGTTPQDRMGLTPHPQTGQGAYPPRGSGNHLLLFLFLFYFC